MISPERWLELKEQIVELCDFDAAERARRLAAIAQADPETARELHAYLEAFDRADGLLARAYDQQEALLLAWSAEANGEGSLPGAEAVEGMQLGPWRLVRPLGHGGMAEVWEGQRTAGDFEQTVAVKLLKRGMDSDEIVRRFEHERQILARLDHPGIARLFDGGLAPDGRPYFVLEKIDGEPITAWCARAAAPVATRLKLLIEIAGSVAAAHRQLVVHRDIKPSNVLVTADGRTRLLDFGIAKLLADDGESPAATRAELRLLTPAYAAPEQIRGDAVSTATDVYALGVLAYELLTGRLPHRRAERGAAALVASLDTESVTRPSAAVLAPPAPGSANPPPSDPRRLSRLLAGDLDAVVMQALRREPERRYPSVAAFADDLGRYLAGRPVTARRDSLGYRARKFVGRHRLGVAATAVALTALVAALALAVAQGNRAAAEARRSQRVTEFLAGLFEVADPEQSLGPKLTAGELLDQARKRLESELHSEPEVLAELLEVVARVEKSLGRLAEARSLAERARALSGSEDVASHGAALATLGSIAIAEGKLDEAEPLLVESVALLERAGAAEALTLARARSDLGQVAFWREQHAEAERLERQVWETYRAELGDDHVLTAMHLRNLGVLRFQERRLAEAEEAYRDSQAVLERQLGDDHPNVALSYVALAALRDQQGRAAEAEELYRKALSIRRRKLGDTHPATGQTLQLYGLTLLGARRYDEAEAAFREALAIFTAIDPDHFEVGKLHNGLGLVYSRQGRSAEAEKEMSQALAVLRRALGDEHPFAWQMTLNLAQEITDQGRFAEAEPMYREALDRLRAVSGPESEGAADAETRLGDLLRRTGRGAEALPLHRHALGALERIYGKSHVYVAELHFQLAADLAVVGEDMSAERSTAEAMFREHDPENRRLAELAKLAAPGGES